MFSFKKQILDPLVADVSNQIESALKLQSVADKVEQLLSVKKASDEQFKRISPTEEEKASMFFGVGTLVAVGVALFGLLSALPVLPAVAVGFFVFYVVPGHLKLLFNASAASDARQRLDQKIDDEISLVRVAPQEDICWSSLIMGQKAIKSPRFLKVIAQAFNGTASAAFDTGPSSPSPLGPEQKPALDLGSIAR